jgi:hypothetical protein
MRTVKIILLILLALIVIGGGLLWFKSSSLAEQQIRALLEREHIPVQSLTVTGITTKSVALKDIAIGEGGALRAKTASIDFNYAWADGALGAFDATLDGVELRAQLQDGQLLIGGIENAWGTALITPTPQAIAIDLAGKMHITRTEAGALSASLNDGALTLSQHQKNLLLPLKINATAQGEGDQYRIKGSFADNKKNVDGTFSGDYSVESKTGHIQWDTKPMNFTTNGFTFAQLSPGFASGVATITSKASISGVVDLKPDAWTVTPKITLLELPVDTLLAKVLGEKTVIKGSVKGAVPIRISKGGAWRIEKSRLINIGPMAVQMDPATTQALGDNNNAQLVKTALSNLQVDTLTLDVESTDNKGGVKLNWHFIGNNPDFLNGKKVDFTLAVTANLQDIWDNMQQVKRATSAAQKQLLNAK